MSKDSHRYCLGTACIAQFVLHTVPKTVRGQALVRDGFSKEFHHGRRCSIIATWFCEAREDGIAILFSLSVLLQQLKRPGAQWYHPFGAFGFEPADAVWTQVDTALLQVK